MRYIIIILFFLSINVFSQNTGKSSGNRTNQKFVELKYHYGKFARKTVHDVTSIVENPYSAINIRFGLQSSGIKHKWDQIYGFPIYGLGLYKIWFHSSELGSPQALYIFFRPPIIRGKKLTWDFEMATGIAFGFNKYNPSTNKEQKVIGSNINSYINLGTGLKYKVNNRWDITLGLDLTHFSNGAVRTPNIGVNLFGLSSSIMYNFNKKVKDTAFKRNNLEPKELPKLKRNSYLQAVAIAGGKTTTNSIYDGATYFAGSISLDYAYKYCRIGKIGIGLDGFYESSLRHFPEPGIKDATFSDLSYSGIHLAHHLTIYNFRLMLQYGTYLTDKVDHKGKYYMVVTLDYYFTKNIFLSYHLKTRNGSIADFIGVGLGYNFKLN